MKNNVDSKFLLGLLIGGAVGAAIGYLAATDKREQLIDELNDVVGKVKSTVNMAISKYKEGRVAPIIDEVESAAEDAELV
ncbi:hypothetical protein T231_10535 [Tannerella sp. oral taxon BU063 isolate Cell 6/7/9]|jgi:hypothetical protein|uniref:YtxH domain-containing protein n=4 Tax=Tannerella serpentiformis TaxID=712710 RepID=W2CF44_9BACT|nr:YtxH domain-containing protein [Tannerella serpentiformis]ETK02903.1 hypothetical protein N425_01785 [Tannerella sp. oral taxon BU063 isolate Cell 2]ETK04208.1 hypothetical protein T229_10215 [Tannerella sp. oral taxon BU063 isolate Cell 5]ETK05740.1 hypothetical protein T230_16010 [Tannerella sp. oral taxon BU063 isolate Cell 1/3]ETK09205.1 hypothetical protein T231_10535 [Tannerella sp. oral taxon BU063 isolate Cell 6/7/9]RKW66511.1 MAG: YtxH domain-containing protein [Tannerella sp.]